MSKLDAALARMEAALTRLETAIEAGLPGEVTGVESPEVPSLRAERDQLAGEVQALRARAEDDARLRSEAANAVRDALRDLRGAVGQGSPTHA